MIAHLIDALDLPGLFKIAPLLNEYADLQRILAEIEDSLAYKSG